MPVIVRVYTSPALAVSAITSRSTETASPCSTVIATVSEILYPVLEIAHAVIAHSPTVVASQTPALSMIVDVMLEVSPVSRFSRV